MAICSVSLPEGNLGQAKTLKFLIPHFSKRCRPANFYWGHTSSDGDVVEMSIRLNWPSLSARSVDWAQLMFAANAGLSRHKEKKGNLNSLVW